jgi:hypothetical protein
VTLESVAMVAIGGAVFLVVAYCDICAHPTLIGAFAPTRP